MANLDLEWSDIWVLQALHILSPTGGRLDLEGLIAIADAINHAVVTFEELNNAFYRLKKAELISSEKGEFQFTKTTQALFNRFSGQSYGKQGDSICEALSVPKWSPSYDPNRLLSLEVFVSKSRFNQAVMKYQSRYR